MSNQNNQVEDLKNYDKTVKMIAFIQDDFDTPNELKYPHPENYLSQTNTPKEVLDVMKKKENSWADEKGNVHFSRDFQPEPFMGTDGEVYLWVGDISMRTNALFMKNMNAGLELIEREVA